MPHARAAILSIGDELTLGQSVDTNSAWLSARLLDMGILVAEHGTVPDDAPSITAAIRRLAAGANLVISTGGLGPTTDDLTRAGLAGALGEPPEEDPAALDSIRAYLSAGGRAVTDANRVQAQRPRSAAWLQNNHGTAPGLAARVGDADVFCLPGPPREMMPMFGAHVAPRLVPPSGRCIATRSIHTVGLPESEVARRLGELMDRDRNPTVGTTVSRGIVTCRLRYDGSADAGPVMDALEVQVRSRLAPHIFGVADDTLASTVLGLLRGRGQTLATVESCTGGLLGSMLTAVPGSSAAYLGGWITYSNDLKRSQVGVPPVTLAPNGPGAVSREVAEAMATGGLDRSGADHALAITGVAGPDGGTVTKPVGTVWIALQSRQGGQDSRRFRFVGGRDNVRLWSSTLALEMLRLRLVAASGVRLQGEQPPR
ncbi:MAG: CinA family nicotinamide mononucleotide deamidase-related protein [Phycisphaerales bacterium]|nr:CinA family nicotinamide mononucleotide deamidase-related protein [Phycisphaerales bacterium]